MQVGTSSHSPLSRGTDYAFISLKFSDDHRWLVPALTAWVHPSSSSHDVFQSGAAQVSTFRHPPTYVGEGFEVSLLTGQERIRDEVRDDSSKQDRKAANLPFECLVAPVRSKSPAAKVFLT